MLNGVCQSNLPPGHRFAHRSSNWWRTRLRSHDIPRGPERCQDRARWYRVPIRCVPLPGTEHDPQLILSLVAIVVYVAVAIEFFYRYFTNKPIRTSEQAPIRPLPSKLGLMVIGLGISTLFIFIRSVSPRSIARVCLINPIFTVRLIELSNLPMVGMVGLSRHRSISVGSGSNDAMQPIYRLSRCS